MKINHSDLIIKRATLSDIPILIEHRILFFLENSSKSKDEINQLKQSLSHYFDKSISQEKYISYLAKYHNRFISSANMIVEEYPPRFSQSIRLHGTINAVYTLKEYRKNGISTLLLKALINEAKDRGFYLLNLLATKTGLNVYKQLGFVEPEDLAMELLL